MIFKSLRIHRHAAVGREGYLFFYAQRHRTIVLPRQLCYAGACYVCMNVSCLAY